MTSEQVDALERLFERYRGRMITPDLLGEIQHQLAAAGLGEIFGCKIEDGECVFFPLGKLH